MKTVVILLLLAVLVVSAFLLFVVRPARRERKRVRGRREAPALSPAAQPDAGLRRLLVPSVLCIAVSMLCLCGASWAWFNATVSTAPLEILTASYTVSVQQDGTDITASADATYSLPLTAGTAYTVTITPTGTASTGFCTVNFEGSTYYTPQLAPNAGAFTFTVIASQPGNLIITPQWGTCATTDASKIIGTAIGATTTQTADAPQQADVPDFEAGTGADANPQDPASQPSDSSNAPAQSAPAGASDSAASDADAGTDSGADADKNESGTGTGNENPAASSGSSDAPNPSDADTATDQTQPQSAQSLDGAALPEN